MKYIIEADERSELVQVISVMPNGTVYTNERSIDELEELTMPICGISAGT